jgi:hypothetical protein
LNYARNGGRLQSPKSAMAVLSEANELVAISISSINTAKRNAGLEE